MRQTSKKKRGPAPAAYPADEEREVILRTGSTLRLRPIRTEDAEALLAMYRRLSPDSLYFRFFALPNVDAARALKPFYEREVFGRVAMLFDGRARSDLEALGETRAPSVADLFVAMMRPVSAPEAPQKEAA